LAHCWVFYQKLELGGEVNGIFGCKEAPCDAFGDNFNEATKSRRNHR
jgi:hypothetical protein